MKKRHRELRIRPPDIVEVVRKSAINGAASRLGHNRRDALEEIGSITVEKYIEHGQSASRPICNPRAWAFRVGRNEANAWIQREQKQDSLDVPRAEAEDSGIYLAERQEFASSNQGNDVLRGKEEVLEAMPELFEWFQVRVIDQLDADDRLFYERCYGDQWSEEQIAAEFGISSKAVAQRWRRLLVRLRRRLLQELPAWDRGNELFGEAFQDSRSLADLLCLIRLFIKEGIAAVRGIIESFNQR